MISKLLVKLNSSTINLSKFQKNIIFFKKNHNFIIHRIKLSDLYSGFDESISSSVTLKINLYGKIFKLKIFLLKNYFFIFKIRS